MMRLLSIILGSFGLIQAIPHDRVFKESEDRIIGGEVAPKQVLVITGGWGYSGKTTSVDTFPFPDTQACTVADLPQARRNHVSFQESGQLVTCGGYDSSWTDSCIKYDGASKSWSHHSTLGSRYREYSSFATIDGKACIIGGWGESTSVECYNSAQGSWSNLGETIPGEVSESCAVNIGNTVIVAGGFFGGRQVLERSGGGWLPADTWPELPEDLYGHSCASQGDKVILAGGRISGGYSDSVYFLNPLTRTIEASSNKLNSARAWLGLSVLGDTLYAVGGRYGSEYAVGGYRWSGYLATMEEASNTEDPAWTVSTKELKEARGYFGIAVVSPAVLGC